MMLGLGKLLKWLACLVGGALVGWLTCWSGRPRTRTAAQRLADERRRWQGE